MARRGEKGKIIDFGMNGKKADQAGILQIEK
jgi:hypothetical protein